MTAKARRIFLGIPLPEDISKHLAKQIQAFPGKIIPFQNWHLTLHFLGNVEEEKLCLVHKALQSLALGDPFWLTFNRLGAFPHPKRARILWVGAKEGGTEINHLVQITGNVLAPLGFTIDQRSYLPHLTVRRLPPFQNIAQMIETHPFQKVSMTVDRLILYESILNQGPPHYIELYVYELGSAPTEGRINNPNYGLGKEIS